MTDLTVVTGATGHVGANLVRALLDRGRRVRALLYDDGESIEGLGIEMVKGDVRDIDSLNLAFTGANVVYHLAAQISLSMKEWPLLEATNVAGTKNVVKACQNQKIHRLVHFSSIHAFNQEPINIKLDESRPLVESPAKPPYDRSKSAGEKEVRHAIEQGLDAIIINPTAVIGPHDYLPSHMGDALISLARGKLPALVSGGFDWVDVRDVVEGAIKAETQASAGSRYLLSGHWVSLCDVAKVVEEMSGIPSPRFVCPSWLASVGVPFTTTFARLSGKRPLYTKFSLQTLCSNRNVSHERATIELGYSPRPFQNTIEDTLRWFRDNRYI